VDPFAVALIVVVAAAVLGAVLCARASAGRPLSESGRGPDSRPAALRALESQDLEEMLGATNARRRTRGLPERSITDAIREFDTE
jgi:hypothetical protein